jgi:hypothetical protein
MIVMRHPDRFRSLDGAFSDHEDPFSPKEEENVT